MLTVFISCHDEARGLGGWAYGSDGVSCNDSELVPIPRTESCNGVLTFTDVSEVAAYPAITSLPFLNAVGHYLTSPITQRWVPFKCDGFPGDIDVIRSARWV